ncbi:MAG: glutamate--tRNA ligase, partial [Thermodesulfobacteriota bacterium]
THKVFDRIMEERDLKLGKIAQPVRVALTGGTVSPGIFEVMDILGKDKVLKRLNAAIYVIPNEESSN